jgi:tRNA nucleotidyltransferase (CCA-adding enzyme)
MPDKNNIIIPSEIALPKDVEYILNKLYEAGYEAYIVGGCVRDYLLGKIPKDWDITTSALPLEVKSVFKHTYDTGIEHGTVTVLIGKTGYEVTTYRIDGEYRDNRHPESVVFTSKLTGDLARRDFTMNAIAYNPIDGFVDEFNGIEDICAGVINAVREPTERFQEDALRMMRAIRFSAQLGFEIEPKTKLAIEENAYLIKNISVERVRDELIKLLLSSNPLKIYLLKSVGILDYALPELSNACEDNKNEIEACLETVEADEVKRLTCILHNLKRKPLERLLRFMRLDNKTIKAVVTLSESIDTGVQSEDFSPYRIRRLICDTDVENVRSTLYMLSALKIKDTTSEVRLLDEITANGDCCNMSELAISGDDLQRLGVPKGKQLGDMLKKCLDEVLQTPGNNNKKYLLEEVCGLCTH